MNELREALQQIIDLPTVTPDHAHGGVHPPYLEWHRVAAIARAALLAADVAPAHHYWVGNKGAATGGNIPKPPPPPADPRLFDNVAGREPSPRPRHPDDGHEHWYACAHCGVDNRLNDLLVELDERGVRTKEDLLAYLDHLKEQWDDSLLSV